MSRRHRETQMQSMPVEERRRERRRVRHETRVLLSVADPDELPLPMPVHTRPHTKPTRSERRFRHWKAPFWKRRTASRHERNVALASLIGE